MNVQERAVADALAGRPVTRAPDQNGHHSEQSQFRPTFIKASELKAKAMPAHRWTVYGILAEGLALFVGRPKIGKSWWALIVGTAIASGGIALGQIRVEAGDVLYLSLEDNERRLKARMTSILGTEPWPDRLTFATTWPRLDQGGLNWIEAWCEKHPDARLVIIDTLQKVRPAAAKNGSLYADDYRALEGLQKLAGKRRITVLVLHHTRKMGSDDPLETVSGTQGLGGAADSVLVLKRDRSHRDATLFVTGRDVEESEITLRWDAATTSWTLLGEELSEERQRVLDLLAHAGKALHVRDIAIALGRPEPTTRTLCWKMSNDRQILTNGKAAYSTNPTYKGKADIGSKGETADIADIGKQAVVSGISSVSGVGGLGG